MFTAGRGAERGWETDSARASHHAEAPEVPGAPSAGSLSPRMGLPSCGFDSFPGDLPPAQHLHIPQSPQSKDEMASSQHLKEHLKVQSFHQEFCPKSFAVTLRLLSYSCVLFHRPHSVKVGLHPPWELDNREGLPCITGWWRGLSPAQAR